MKTKIYISGQTSNISQEAALYNYQTAEIELIKYNYEPINPFKHNLNNNDTLRNKLLNNVLLLLDCNSIYMLNNWDSCALSQIDHNIAITLEMNIIYQSKAYDYEFVISAIKGAIKNATSFDFDEYIIKGRQLKYVYCRMLFIHQCKALLNMHNNEIAKLIARDRSTVSYHLKKHDTEVKFNSNFRYLYSKVNLLINTADNTSEIL